MRLQAGQKLGPYEIAEPLGAGGMGEVFRARDIRLERSVAIKLLPAHLAAEPDRRARFEREARLISNLNHPNICSLYDIRSDDGVEYLVMELVEGRSLADRLSSGPLPIAEVLRYGAQIATALAAAHRKGIIHRDLKPGNIMLSKTGAKLLDFGLATAEPRAATEATATVTMAITEEHTIVGTLQYMAPEQLEGRSADPRSDIFAFGAVLYEMVTGRKAFDGASKASLISAVMTADPPPASSLQPVTPLALDRTIRQCLAKDPEDRWQDAADLARELSWLAEAGSQAGIPAVAVSRKRRREALAWGTAAVCLLIAAGLGGALYRTPARDEPQAVRFNLPDPPGTAAIYGIPMVSPDGGRVLFGASSDGVPRLWIHHLGVGEATPVPGTEGVSNAIWADDRLIAFPRKGRGYVLDLLTGGLRDVTTELGPVNSAVAAEGLFVVAISGRGLWQTNPDGGPLRQIAPHDPATGNYFLPFILPGGRSLLASGNARGTAVPAFRIDVASGARESLPIANSSQIAYSPSGHLVYISRDSLVAQPFEPARGRISGSPIRLAGPIQDIPGAPQAKPFSISRNGVLAYRGGSLPEDRLTWYSRKGEVLGTVAEPGDYSNPALSFNGSKLAVGLRDPVTRTRDIWVFDLTRGARARVTTDPADDLGPVFSPDGERLLFSSDRGGKRALFLKAIQGGDESRLFVPDAELSAEDWSPDGRFATFNRSSNGVWAVPLDGSDRKPFPVENRPGARQSKFSPDGKWLAFVSTDLGQSEVFVGAFPATEWKVRVSVKGGTEPHWSTDGKELFYMKGNRLMAVPVSTDGGRFQAGTPVLLFEIPLRPLGARNRFLPSPDGKRFLFIVPSKIDAIRPITVVLNWTALLKPPRAR